MKWEIYSMRKVKPILSIAISVAFALNHVHVICEDEKPEVPIVPETDTSGWAAKQTTKL